MAFGGNEDSPQNRTTMGLAFLVVGLVLLMWAWGSWIYRTSKAAPPLAIKNTDVSEGSVRAVGLSSGMIVGGLLLLVIFLAASFVLVRASRRYRQGLLRKDRPATDSSDVWSMHRVKDFSDSDG